MNPLLTMPQEFYDFCNLRDLATLRKISTATRDSVDTTCEKILGNKIFGNPENTYINAFNMALKPVQRHFRDCTGELRPRMENLAEITRILGQGNDVRKVELEKLAELQQFKFVDLPGETKEHLCLDNGILAIFSGLLTFWQAAALPSDHLLNLLTDDGLAALRKHLLTPEQAAAFTSAKDLRSLLSYNGQAALRAKLITPKQAAELPSGHLHSLMSHIGLTALRKGIMTPERAATFQSSERLYNYMSLPAPMRFWRDTALPFLSNIFRK